MNEEERKKRFIDLLSGLLADHSGIKIKLADRLKIKPPTLTRWFQGKVDPATLDLAVFVRVAEVANRSIDDLAFFLGVVENSEEKILDNFKSFIQDLLSGQSHESLAKKLGISDGAVAGWVRSQRKGDPRRVAISTIAGLAKEKAWTIERLLIYLGLKEIETEEDLFFKLKSGASTLSLQDRVKLLAWLSDDIQQEIIQENTSKQFVQSRKNRTICVLLEKDNLAIASNYSSNLVRHAHIEPDNIKIATITQFEEVKEDLDLIIFDIETNSSNIIELINEISFNGDIVIFTSQDLEAEVRSQLEDKVTDIVVKPHSPSRDRCALDWESLKDKPYFTST